MQSEKSQGVVTLYFSGGKPIDESKCDEAKPLCKKCSIHFSNIKACDYGPNPEVVKKASPKKTTGISPLRNDVPARLRRRCVPTPTEVSGVTEGSSDPNNVLSITSHHFSTLGGKIDPFSVLPGESSPRVHSLMHHCTIPQVVLPFIKLTTRQGLPHWP
jgi:hypothetical protein